MSAETSGGAGPSPDGGNAVVGTPVRREPGTEGFFRPDGDLLVPAAFATSPWGQVVLDVTVEQDDGPVGQG